MNDIKIFERPEFGKVSTIEEDGVKWFLGSDIATILNYDKDHFFMIIDNFVEDHKITIGSDLYKYDKNDINAFLFKNSIMYMSDFGTELFFDYMYVHDGKRMKHIADNIDIGYVYVIDDMDNDKRKIGKTKNPRTRTSNVCSSAGVKNKKIFVSEKVINCSELENTLKEEFAADNIHGEWFTSSFDDIVKSLTEKTIEVCPVLEQLKTVFTESSSAAFLENMKRVTGWNDNKKIVSPNYDDSWIFTNDRLPDKELGQILVDLYPLSGVHSYEVIEYIDGLNAFFSCAEDTTEPVDFSTVLCWRPIYPPAPRKD